MASHTKRSHRVIFFIILVLSIASIILFALAPLFSSQQYQ